MDPISSLQNEKVKLARSLQLRPRARRKERKILLEGTRLIRDAIEQGLRPHFLLFDPDRIESEMLGWLDEQGVQPIPVTAEVIAHISDTQQPQGIAAVFSMPRPALPSTADRVLILDRLRDPGNVGTMLRTAAAAGVQVVVLSPECADPYNPKTLRSGMGAHFRVPVIEASWEDVARYCEGMPVYLADGGGELDYDAVDWTDRWALVIGSEAHGLSAEVAWLNSRSIRIPMAAQTESLNASIAAGIILFEAARQRRKAKI